MIKNDFTKAHFPAYDDAKGVKLNLNKPKRNLFNGNDDFLTEHSFTNEARQVLDRRKRPEPTGRRSVRNVDQTPSYTERPERSATRNERSVRSTSRSSQRSVVDFAKSTRPTRSGTPFSPTKVPKSLIPDAEETVSASEILAGLQKAPTSYLLFTTAPAEPEVKKARNSHRLERSLSGIMEENTVTESKYFKE